MKTFALALATTTLLAVGLVRLAADAPPGGTGPDTPGAEGDCAAYPGGATRGPARCHARRQRPPPCQRLRRPSS